jgi:hypothetical protein
MHLCNQWGTGEIKIFRGSDYAQIGSVKLWEDADPIGYDPYKTPLRHQRRWRGAPRVRHPNFLLVFLPRWAKQGLLIPKSNYQQTEPLQFHPGPICTSWAMPRSP